MSTPATVISGSPTNPQTALDAGEKRKRWFEVSLLLLVAFGGHILSSINLLIHGPSAAPQVSSYGWAALLVEQLTALLLLGYILSRRGLRFANLGLRWSQPDVLTGVLVTAVSYAAYGLGRALVQTVHHLIYGSFATGLSAKNFFAHPSALAVLVSLLNPFFEELIVRAYLMTEVIQLTGSSALAIALSAGVQFSYHLYYGWVGAISLSFFFLALALYYARSRLALPIIVAHGLVDVATLFRIWW